MSEKFLHHAGLVFCSRPHQRRLLPLLFDRVDIGAMLHHESCRIDMTAARENHQQCLPIHKNGVGIAARIDPISGSQVSFGYFID